VLDSVAFWKCGYTSALEENNPNLEEDERKVAGLRLIRNCAEFLTKDDVSRVPRKRRGVYALHQKCTEDNGKQKFDVVYIGMSRTDIRGRLEAHARSRRKADLWSHFSVFSVWPNITNEEIEELEGLFRAIYRKDSKANKLAVQKGFLKLRKVRDNDFKWPDP
jgi:hypothetical protein